MQSVFIGFTHPSYLNGHKIEHRHIELDQATELFKDSNIYTLIPHLHKHIAEVCGLQGPLFKGNVQPRTGDKILFIAPVERIELPMKEIPELMLSLAIVL